MSYRDMAAEEVELMVISEGRRGEQQEEEEKKENEAGDGGDSRN